MKTLTNSLFLVAGLGGVAWGNAFNVNEHDAKAAGRGGAVAASVTDAASVIFNPGGIPVGEGTQVSVSGTLYIAEGSYEPVGGPATKTDASPQFAPTIAATSRLNDMFAIGVALHFPFGLAISWPDQHPQSEVVVDETLRTFFITPSVGVNLDKQVPGLSIGGGLDLVPATIELERELVFGTERGTAQLGGDAVGLGGRFGVMYQPPAVKRLKLGVMYRTPVTLDFEGTGDFDIAQPYRDALPPDGAIAASITLPQQVWGGIAYAPIEQLELEANAVWINWSDTWKNDQLRIDLPGTDAMGEPNVTVSRERYKDTVTFRFGAEYALRPQHAAVRAGFLYDPTPIERDSLTAILPDANRKELTIGGSYYFGDYTVHGSFLWVLPSKRTTSEEPFMPVFKGEYEVTAYVPTVTLSGVFGK